MLKILFKSIKHFSIANRNQEKFLLIVKFSTIVGRDTLEILLLRISILEKISEKHMRILTSNFSVEVHPSLLLNSSKNMIILLYFLVCFLKATKSQISFCFHKITLISTPQTFHITRSIYKAIPKVSASRESL